MIKFLQTATKRILLIGLFLVCLSTAWAQTEAFQNGVRKGMVKVKFSTTMTPTLNTMQVNARGGKLSTGIETFDAVAQQSEATKMYRLFPYDARFENKLRKHGLHLWYVVEIDKNADPKKVAAQFKQLKEIATAEVDREKVLAPYQVQNHQPSPAPSSTLPFNDPYLKDQWHYNNSNQTGFGDADVNLFEAWATTTGANNIVVSIHDQGVDVNHNDLKANIWVNQAEQNGTPNVDDDGNGYIDDINGYNFEKNKGAVDAQYHGTHVAGTIAAVNNNGIGVSGVAGGDGTGNGVKVMSLQIFGGAAVEKSYVYAANNGAVISQNSWGYSSPGYFEQSVLDAIDYFTEEAGDFPGSPMKGGIVIFAAGNSNYDSEWYPGYHPAALAVGALGPEWKKAAYSNYGAWVELSAPGGDMTYGSSSGVLSTIPNNKYAYLEGTSMACPHVSGIAALALANRTKQLTNDELWNKLVTGVVDIDQYNPDYTGKLGTGAIDAALAIQNDLGIAPAGITNLLLTGISQEFATFSWAVPADTDDGQPLSFDLYHHTEPLTAGNLNAAVRTHLPNKLSAGSEFVYELDSLLGLTTYYFVVTSTDRWGNVSVLSNEVTATTNEGPSIAVDENSQSISLEIDAATSALATHDITILNNAAGILRWNHFMRHTNTSLSWNAASLNYPVVTKKKTADSKLLMRNSTNGSQTEKLRSNEPEPMAFESVEKSYSSWPTNIIGETDLALTNSAAAKFMVTEPDGFNLTQVSMYLKHDPAIGPVIVEVYKGNAPVKSNLIYAQEHSNWSADEAMAYITLNEQLYFESGSTFWIAFHVPAGNLFPLGIGYENDPAYSNYCYFSTDLGSTWIPLETAIASDDFAWSMTAASYNAHLGTYLTLEPGSGDVAGMENQLTTLTANAETLINGSYSANLVLTSNDAQNQELRIPVNLTVSGHKPKIKHIDIADFGSVFKGTTKTLELVLENNGYGNFNNPNFSIDHADYTIDGYAPWQIKAREEVTVKIKFSPTSAGNINGKLTFTNGDQTYQISLFGVGTETSTIALTPETQLIDNVTIGDEVNAQITVENTGAYPLKYFIPGFDEKGISDTWPSDYHSYGYKFRTSYAAEADPLSYEYQDISATGVNITNQIDGNWYYALDMGFEFPFYSDKMSTIYVAKKGFTVFDNSIQGINTPTIPGNEWTPKGYISLLGTHLNYVAQGEIFYQKEADRVIIQYNNVSDGWTPGSLTAQMVLYSNGNIRFFYQDLGWPSESLQYLSILMEDMAQSDGILVHNWQKPIELYSGLALGFDYPGPNIITAIANGSGIVAPGSSVAVDVTMNTNTLAEGLVNRYVNFISNDPFHSQQTALIQLNITDGGTAQPLVTLDTIKFGNVFQGAIRSVPFLIKNPGTANVNITSMNFVNGDFALTGERPTSILPGLYKDYSIQIPTSSIATLEDWLSINYADGTHDTIYVTGAVVVPPAINVDLSLLQQTLAYGTTSSHPFTIENTGLADLEVSTAGTQWLSFNATGTPADFGYTVEKNNDGTFYQWIDIRETGTQMPFVNFDDYEGTFWRTLDLPFPIEFYGVTYTSMKIGDNGIISFEDEPQASFFTDYIPSQTHPGPCIMPYWTFSGFSDYIYPIEDIGIFYQFYDDKFIITWSYFTNNFGGMGDPVSAQVIFYNNGTMKFQYKKEEGGVDATSHFGTIGLQKDSNTGIGISEYLPLDYGTGGLAYIITPAKKYVVAPGSTLSGDIVLDATNIYGGQYNASLKINNNVPNSEFLEKPVELTVTGDGVLAVAESVDFGSKMVQAEGWSYKSYYVDMPMANTGSAPIDITWAQMTDGMQGLSLQIWALVDGWFGPEWRWADISELYSPWAWPTPVFTIKPGESLKARAVFTPSYAGTFTDELVLTTSLGETHIPFTGTGFEPPVMNVDQTPIEKTMSLTTETATASIAFDNMAGASDLTYDVSIDFGRATTSRSATEAMSIVTQQNTTLASAQAQRINNSGARTTTTYNRTLKHTSKDTPDTFVGTGGSAPFTLATQYNAGAQGFNLSHVETWFRTETVTQGTIEVEIRAGGTSIADAVLLASGSQTFTGSGSDDAGSMFQVALDQPAGIYPNENFYVIVTYPLGIQFPQGTVTGEPSTPGRYYYFAEGLWYDVQEESSFGTAGWLMFAGEETAGNSSWLTITSPTSGTLAAGASGSIELLLEGPFAQRGDQLAKVVITSNDPTNTSVNVPVTLHMNEGPHFSNVPESILIAEGETLVINMGVTDEEDNTFTVASAQSYPGVTHSFNNGTLTVTLAPDFGDAGQYAYTFTATDEHNAVTEIVIPAEVLHTNRAPQFIGEETMSFTATGLLNEYEVSDFYSDPDGDAFTFTLSSDNTASVVVFGSENQFLIRPMEVGEAKIAFEVTDSKGAVSRDTITVTVDVVLGSEEDLLNNGLGAYPNPTLDFTTVTVTNDWTGEVSLTVLDAAGRRFINKQMDASVAREAKIDVSGLSKGIYIIRAVSSNKQATIKFIKK
ncbi:MAG: S8 family serine peptidase [Cyclobacteriaceae bacterium]